MGDDTGVRDPQHSAAPLRVERLAVGGAGLAHDEDGRVVFVERAIPGDVVVPNVTRRKKRYSDATIHRLLEPSPLRVASHCPTFDRGCGGCVVGPVDPDVLAGWRHDLVVDTLSRHGGVDDPSVRLAASLPSTGFRTTLRGVAGKNGRLALRGYRSHDLVEARPCTVLHPLLAATVDALRLPPGVEASVRVGVASGEVTVRVHGRLNGDEPAAIVATVESVGSVTTVGVVDKATARASASDGPSVHEHVAGRTWRVSADSFFQTRPDGAEMLVDEVRRVVAAAPRSQRVVDVCSGVGLLGGSVAAAELTAVEVSPSACADARINLVGAADTVDVVQSTLEKWRPVTADVAIADPARSGLARAGVEAVCATGAEVVALVSCDIGSLGRDIGLFRAAGFELVDAVVIDMFPHTAHAEVVSHLQRLRVR